VLREIPSVCIGHGNIHDQDPVWRTLLLRPLQFCYRCFTVAHHFTSHALACEALLDEFANNIAAINDQDRNAAQGPVFVYDRCNRRSAAIDRKRESAALSDLARDADFTSHQVNQSLADGKAKSSAAILARRGAVCLGEGFKKLATGSQIHADAGIAYFDTQSHAPAAIGNTGYLDRNLTLFRKFNCIADQVDQYLPQA